MPYILTDLVVQRCSSGGAKYFMGFMESASGRMTIMDSGVLEQGHTIYNVNYRAFDKNSWHDSNGEGIPDSGKASALRQENLNELGPVRCSKS